MINMPTLMLYSSTEVKGNIMEREITMKLLLYRRTNDFFFQIFIVKYVNAYFQNFRILKFLN